MTNFETPQYVLARAISDIANRVKELEAFDNAIFEIKTTAGRPTARGNYHFVINTADNTVEIYADGSWQDLIGAGGGGYTDEDAQDAVGNILTDTATIDFTYDDATPEITADVIPGGVDHDSLLNFVGNEHIDHTAVTLTAGDGLSGGGDISANRTFDVDMLGLEDLADPGADRIYFWDDGAGLSTWLTANTGLEISGTDLNVDILGLEDLVDPDADRIYFWDDGAGLSDWLVPNDHLSISGTNLNVDDDFVLNTGDTIDGNLIIDNTDTEAFLVRKNADGGDVFVIDTSNGMVGIKSQYELRFYDNGNYVGFEAPALSADQIWVLPDEDGAADEFLQTDGAGNLTWAAGGAGSGGNCYIETGSYTGDGSTGQTISLTDSSLVVKHIHIYLFNGDDSNTAVMAGNDELEDAGSGRQYSYISGSPSVVTRDNRLELGTGEFIVDDGGVNAHPNQNGDTYYFTVMGTH